MRFDPDQAFHRLLRIRWPDPRAGRNTATLSNHQADARRERAEHYRRLARGPVPWPVVAQLERLADECEREASVSRVDHDTAAPHLAQRQART